MIYSDTCKKCHKNAPGRCFDFVSGDLIGAEHIHTEYKVPYISKIYECEYTNFQKHAVFVCLRCIRNEKIFEIFMYSFYAFGGLGVIGFIFGMIFQLSVTGWIIMAAILFAISCFCSIIVSSGAGEQVAEDILTNIDLSKNILRRYWTVKKYQYLQEKQRRR